MGFSDFILSNYDPKTGRRYFQVSQKQAQYDEKWKRAKSYRLDNDVADYLAVAGMLISSDSTTSSEKQKIKEVNSAEVNRHRDEMDALKEQNRIYLLKAEEQLEELTNVKQELKQLFNQIKLEKMDPVERENFEKKQAKKLFELEDFDIDSKPKSKKQLRKESIEIEIEKREEAAKKKFKIKSDERRISRELAAAEKKKKKKIKYIYTIVIILSIFIIYKLYIN